MNIRNIRELIGMTRREFSALTKVGESTINFYETNPQANISLTCLNKIAAGLNKIGVLISVESFLEKQSFAPYFTHDFFARFLMYRKSKLPLPMTNLTQEQIIRYELANFLMHNPNAIGVTVNDDTMLPYFGRGDVLGGVWVPLDENQALLNKLCIFTLKNRELTPLCGILTDFDKAHYILSNTNPELSIHKKLISTDDVDKLYEIIWIRRKILN